MKKIEFFESSFSPYDDICSKNDIDILDILS